MNQDLLHDYPIALKKIKKQSRKPLTLTNSNRVEQSVISYESKSKWFNFFHLLLIFLLFHSVHSLVALKHSEQPRVHYDFFHYTNIHFLSFLWLMSPINELWKLDSNCLKIVFIVHIKIFILLLCIFKGLVDRWKVKASFYENLKICYRNILIKSVN